MQATVSRLRSQAADLCRAQPGPQGLKQGPALVNIPYEVNEPGLNADFRGHLSFCGLRNCRSECTNHLAIHPVAGAGVQMKWNLAAHALLFVVGAWTSEP